VTDEQAWDRLFDELYLKTYAPLQESEQAETMAREAIALARCEPGADVLDVPCGFGRHSLVLAQDGYRVVGLDRSTVLLDEARRRSPGADWPRWVSGDYRELPFDDASFDAVLHLFSSFGYYSEADDERMFAGFRRVLRPDGRLVLETMHRDRLVEIFQPRSWDELPDGAVLLQSHSFDPVPGLIRTDHTYWPRGGDPVKMTYELRVYTATEVKNLLEHAGFSAIDVYGSLGGEALTTDRRLVMVARP
jgi:ubiquinone/menaquinone biosynthesis C-methylase UbiE